MKTKLFIVIFFILSILPNMVIAGEFSANVLAKVNQLRQAKGLDPFLPDSALQIEAEDISMERASKLKYGHLYRRGANFRNNTTARGEGVGYYSDVDWEGEHFITCYLYTKQYKYAGAGISVADNGRTFYTLRLR